MDANTLGWIGNICFIIGMLLLADKKRPGFIFCMLGDAFYAVQGQMLHMNSLLWISVFLTGVNTYGFIKWGRIPGP
jgi:hypothetical protein